MGGKEHSATVARPELLRPLAIAAKFSLNQAADGSCGSRLNIRKKRRAFADASAKTSLLPTATTTILGPAVEHLRQSLEHVEGQIAADAEVTERKAPVLRPLLELADPVERLTLSRRAARADAGHRDVGRHQLAVSDKIQSTKGRKSSLETGTGGMGNGPQAPMLPFKMLAATSLARVRVAGVALGDGTERRPREVLVDRVALLTMVFLHEPQAVLIPYGLVGLRGCGGENEEQGNDARAHGGLHGFMGALSIRL